MARQHPTTRLTPASGRRRCRAPVFDPQVELRRRGNVLLDADSNSGASPARQGGRGAQQAEDWARGLLQIQAASRTIRVSGMDGQPGRSARVRRDKTVTIPRTTSYMRVGVGERVPAGCGWPRTPHQSGRPRRGSKPGVGEALMALRRAARDGTPAAATAGPRQRCRRTGDVKDRRGAAATRGTGERIKLSVFP